MMPTALAPTTLATVKVRRQAPSFILYLVILFVWVSVWRVQDLWPVFAKIKLPILLEFSLVLALVAGTSLHRRIKLIKSPIFLAPLGLLALMVIGLPLNLYRMQGFTFIEKDFFPTIVLFLVLSLSIREAYDLEWIAFLQLLGAAAYSLYVYKYIPIGSDGRLGGLVYYDANDFALLIDCTIPFAIYFARPGVVVWKRIVAVLILVLLLVMLTKSGSRGGFLGFIGVMLYTLFRFRAIPKRLRVGAVVGGAALLMAVGSTAYWHMMQSITDPKGDYNTTDEIGRKAIWKRGFGYMLTHPVFGVGAAAFGQAEGRISEISHERGERNQGLKWSTAHNSFVLVGAELGFAGILLWVSMIGGALRVLNKVRSGSGGVPGVTLSDEAYAQMLSASLVGFCIAGFFISASYYAYLFILIGLAVAQHGVLKRRIAMAAEAGTEQRSPQPAAVRARRPRLPRAHWAPTG